MHRLTGDNLLSTYCLIGSFSGSSDVMLTPSVFDSVMVMCAADWVSYGYWKSRCSANSCG